jgi:hypothetical protein
MELERDLERVLRRERPSAGFAARVMKRIEEQAAEEAERRRRQAPWFRAVAAAVLLTLLGGGFAARHEMERRRGERAKAEVLLALRITGAKMHAAREHVRELGAPR